MNLPKDPVLLASCLNTLLRDDYDSLEELCDDRELCLSEVLDRLEDAGLSYDENTRRVR